MAAIVEVKRRLTALWAKANDKEETYEFDLTGDSSWGCVRKNPTTGSRRFRVIYDAENEQLWWGESYYLDFKDLRVRPDKASWYRASDRNRTQPRAAFSWVKVRDLVPKPDMSRDQSNQRKIPPDQRRAHLTSQSVRVLPRPQVDDREKYADEGASAAPRHSKPHDIGPESRGERVAPRAEEKAIIEGLPSNLTLSQSGSSMWQTQPEIVVNLEQTLVLYKPPYWMCELPAPAEANAPEDSCKKPNLLRWIRASIPSIDQRLFSQTTNPAQSGTGFGPLGHRLDAETSGLLLVAKTYDSLQHLRVQFVRTKVSKRYVCLVHGHLTQLKGVIAASIRTVRTDNRTRSEVSSTGVWARTRYQVIATYGPVHRTCAPSIPQGYSLVACDITSGRAHQIRVHLEHLGHPLVSDDKYQVAQQVTDDRGWCRRLFLHNFRLGFEDITGGEVCTVCPLPDDLKSAITSLGAPETDETGILSDMLFDETSWRNEVLWPPNSHWRPSSRVERKLVEMLGKDGKTLPAKPLNNDKEFRRIMEEEGVSSINETWLHNHRHIFEVAPSSSTKQLSIRLRPSQMSVVGETEQQIKKMQTELQELRQQKQRYIAQEEYHKAADVKRREDSFNAELASLLALRNKALEAQTNNDREDEEDMELPKTVKKERERAKMEGEEEEEYDVERRREKEKVDITPDMSNNDLFPVLSKAVPKTAAPAVPRNVASQASAEPVKAAETSGGKQTSHENAEKEKEHEISLEEALIAFLSSRDGIAHMNEVNNDKYLRQVMALQPKPMVSVNKNWLKEHSDVFSVLRTKENEIHIGLEKETKKLASAKAKAAPRAARAPAYHQVVQLVSDGTTPLVYNYDEPAIEKGNASQPWREKLLSVLQRFDKASCPIEELVEAVPEFNEAAGARKPREQKELLTVFLQACPETFVLDKRWCGTQERVIVSVKH